MVAELPEETCPVFVLTAVLALANAQCTPTTSSASIYISTSGLTNTGQVSSGSSATIYCKPGYQTYDGASSVTVTCSSSSGTTYSGSTFNTAYCYPKYDYCPTTINNNFGNTTTVTFNYARTIETTVWLQCKPTGLGRNYKGNGTHIQVSCRASADGSTGVWASEDWCSGALGVSGNVAVLALAAVAGLLYKRFF